jgi:hypothetical protein
MRVHLCLSASHERHPVDLPKLPSAQTPLYTRRNRFGDTIMLTRFQHTTCALECLLRGGIRAMGQETLVENAFSHGLRTWTPAYSSPPSYFYHTTLQPPTWPEAQSAAIPSRVYC